MCKRQCLSNCCYCSSYVQRVFVVLRHIVLPVSIIYNVWISVNMLGLVYKLISVIRRLWSLKPEPLLQMCGRTNQRRNVIAMMGIVTTQRGKFSICFKLILKKVYVLIQNLTHFNCNNSHFQHTFLGTPLLCCIENKDYLLLRYFQSIYSYCWIN